MSQIMSMGEGPNLPFLNSPFAKSPYPDSPFPISPLQFVLLPACYFDVSRGTGTQHVHSDIEEKQLFYLAYLYVTLSLVCKIDSSVKLMT